MVVDPMQLLGVVQQSLEQQRQLMDTILQQQTQQQVQQQMQQQRGQQAHQAQQGAPQNGWNERQSQQLNLRGFDNIETFSGGEEEWHNWWWEIKTAVSGLNGDLVEMLSLAETRGIENTEVILGEEQLVDASPERCVYASRETCNVRARCTSSEALTIVKSVT